MKHVLVPNLAGNSKKIVVFAMSWVIKEKKISAWPSVAAARLWLARLRLDRLRLAAAWKPSNLDGFG
jgi:hypothetical protein